MSVPLLLPRTAVSASCSRRVHRRCNASPAAPGVAPRGPCQQGGHGQRKPLTAQASSQQAFHYSSYSDYSDGPADDEFGWRWGLGRPGAALLRTRARAEVASAMCGAHLVAQEPACSPVIMHRSDYASHYVAGKMLGQGRWTAGQAACPGAGILCFTRGTVAK